MYLVPPCYGWPLLRSMWSEEVLAQWCASFADPSRSPYVHLSTLIGNFIHHTFDLLYRKLAFHPCKKAPQCAFGLEHYPDLSLLIHPLNSFTTPFTHGRHRFLGLSCCCSASFLTCFLFLNTVSGSVDSHSGWRPLQDIWVHPSRMTHCISFLCDLISMRWCLSWSGMVVGVEGEILIFVGLPSVDICLQSFSFLTFTFRQGITPSFSSSIVNSIGSLWAFRCSRNLCSPCGHMTKVSSM